MDQKVPGEDSWRLVFSRFGSVHESSLGQTRLAKLQHGYLGAFFPSKIIKELNGTLFGHVSLAVFF